jgi:hypothetical protein
MAQLAFQTAAPEIQLPTISSSAMLVNLSISVWTARRKDTKVSKEVANHKHADKNSVSVHKKLLGDCAEHEAVQKFAGNARTDHYKRTMPWSDAGSCLRLLPTAMYFDYHKEITATQMEFYRLVDEFVDVYRTAVYEARTKLGDMFDEGEYPSIEEIRTKFKFDFTYIPLSEAKDFRLDIGASANAQLQAHYQAWYQEQLASAMGDIWNRLRDALTHMSERLDHSDEIKKVFRDSLVSNVEEMVDIMQKCNVVNDPHMEEARQKLLRALKGVTPEGLRKDAGLRKHTKGAIDEIIKNLPGLG